ncbi:hypothetical protein BREVNS_0844 [Brevinematales bacterium NS]|nr:hypothetical protein BREVNS_0844 [Brevinematales bacterium NS]
MVFCFYLYLPEVIQFSFPITTLTTFFLFTILGLLYEYFFDS